MNNLKHLSMLAVICMLVITSCSPVATETQAPVEPTVTTVAPTSTPRPEKNVALKKPVRVSASWVVDPPERAVNGNSGDWWGAGVPAPAWIEVDLQGIYQVTRINVVEGPTGMATYQIFARGPDGINHPLQTFEVRNSQQQTLKYSPDTALEDISTIRVEVSNSGQGWVGIREIQVFSRDEPKPLPESDKENPPSFLADVDPNELAPITPENALFVEQLAILGRGPVNEIAWSPDGTVLTVASPLGVWLYDPDDLKADPRLLEGHTRDVLSVSFSPDGKTIFSGSQDGTVKQWDAVSGELIQTKWLWADFSHEVGNAPREKEVWSVAFSPNGELFASGAYDGRLNLWDPSTGIAKGELKGHTKQINHLAFSPDGALLASSSIDNTVFLWDVTEKKQLTNLPVAGQVSSLVFSPDGKTLAYGGHGMSVRLWDTTTGEETEIPEFSETLSLAFSPDSLTLAASGMDGSVRFWNAQSGKSEIFKENAGWIMDLSFDPDDSALLIYSWNGMLELLDLETGEEIGLLITHTRPVNTIAFDPDAAYIASGGDDGVIWVWDVATGDLKKAMLGHGRSVTGLAYSPDGNVLASSSFDGTVRLWNAKTATSIAILQGHKSYVRCVVFSPDGKLIASGSTDKTVRLWDIGTGKEKYVLTGHTGEIQSVAFSPDGHWLVSASADKTLRVWDVVAGKEFKVLEGHLSFVIGTDFSPNGDMLASVGGDHWLRGWSWSIVSGTAVTNNRFTPIGHPGWVTSVSFTPDGRLIASANVSSTGFWVAPGEIHLYGADNGYPYALLRGHTKRVTDVAVSADGKLLASGSADGSIRIWGVSQEVSESVSQPTVVPPTTTSAPPSASTAWRDDFDNSLADGWYWIREDTSKWSLVDAPGFLRIYSSPYETNGKTKNRLMRRITVSDFVITTHVLFEPKTNFQFAGLTIYQDDNNFISLGRAFCDTPNACIGNGIYFDNVVDGTWTGNNFATSVLTPNEAYLRLECRGNMVKAFFSYDGLSWIEIGSHTLKPGFLVNGMGLVVSGDIDKSDEDIPADFDYLELSELE